MRIQRFFKDHGGYGEIMSDFGCKEWFSFLPPFTAYVILGFYVLFTTNILAGYFYLLYVIFIYTGMIMGFFCTKCPHYGQPCSYIFAGPLAKKLFTRREGECTPLERAFPVVAFIILLAFPIFFVLNRPVYLIALVGIIILIAFVKHLLSVLHARIPIAWEKTSQSGSRRKSESRMNCSNSKELTPGYWIFWKDFYSTFYPSKYGIIKESGGDRK